ncbi:hypothetical protein ACE6H2_021882 [Prunus campanulata]
MAISPQVFPPRKRRPSAGAFMSPKLSDQSLLRSLLSICQEISSLEPFRFLLRRTSLSMIRKTNLLSMLFEDLCFQELYILLQRIQTLIEDSSHGSKMWLLIQTESLANCFHEFTLDLSTLLTSFRTKQRRNPNRSSLLSSGSSATPSAFFSEPPLLDPI